MSGGLPSDRWGRVEAALSGLADVYERANAAMSLGLAGRMRSRLVADLRPRPGEAALDAGCGPGQSSELLARAISPGGTLILMDPLAGMLVAARERASRAGRDLAVLTVRAKFEDIPLADESVDLALVSYSLRDAVDRRKALAELRRVLKVGGRLGILDLTRPDGRAVDALTRAYVRWVVPAVAGLATLRLDVSPWREIYPTYEAMWTSSEFVREVKRIFEVRKAFRSALGVFTGVVAERLG